MTSTSTANSPIQLGPQQIRQTIHLPPHMHDHMGYHFRLDRRRREFRRPSRRAFCPRVCRGCLLPRVPILFVLLVHKTRIALACLALVLGFVALGRIRRTDSCGYRGWNGGRGRVGGVAVAFPFGRDIDCESFGGGGGLRLCIPELCSFFSFLFPCYFLSRWCFSPSTCSSADNNILFLDLHRSSALSLRFSSSPISPGQRAG